MVKYDFKQTTKGWVLEINDVKKWFIRKEGNLFFTYHRYDGKGFTLIPTEYKLTPFGFFPIDPKGKTVREYENLESAKLAIKRMEKLL